jgi:energy-coupling factor transporter ATP-binding protein EcfA2
MATPSAGVNYGSSNGPSLDPPPERRRYTRRSMPDSLLPVVFPSGPCEGGPGIPCEECEMKVTVYYCVNCDSSLCDRCWEKERSHKPGKLGPDGLPHEKAEVSVVNRLKQTFNPPSDPETQSRMHIEDEDATWFGIGRDGANRPIFQDYGRYATLMANSATGEHAARYPQLVSFIGQTGAGKSTLVKMLIEKQSHHSGLEIDNSMFLRPIVGSVKNDNVPTSGDVHLYADPTTFLTPLPMLYADCEGLEGGENLPIGARYRDVEPQENSKRPESSSDRNRQRGRRWRLSRETRDITWANSPETQKRQYAVTELYPRVLYTFSDVIVFVLQNPKWAFASWFMIAG